MAPDQTKGAIRIPGDLILPRTRHEDERIGFAMSRTEWRRLRRKAQKIQPVVQWWAIISALLSGGALACATNWLIAIFAPKPDKVSIIINGLLALGMAGIALVAFIADAGQRRRAAEDARELLEEMDTIERGHPETFPLISGPEQSAQ